MGVAKGELEKMFHDEMEIIFIVILMFFLLLSFFPPARKYLTYILIFLAVLIFIQILRGSGIIQEVKEYERLAIFRFGHFYKIAGPGWVVVLPFIDRAIKLDLRVQQMDVPPQEVITADEIRVTIDVLIYYRIVDPAKAVLKVKDLHKTLGGFIYATLRDIASDLTLNELFSEIEKINDIVKVKIEPLLAEWGIDIVDVEIKDVRIPEAIQQAMHLRRKAKEEWAAAQYQARARKTLIEALAEAAKKLDEKALAYLYIKEALPKLAEGKSTKIVFPTAFPKIPTGVDKGAEETMTLRLSGLLQEEEPKLLPEEQKKKGEKKE